MTVADYVAGQLFLSGVRYIFGIPGGASIPWIEAFRNAGIEFILTSGEAAAGIMADVSYRLTGIPGVCHATFGPGATNISTGTGCALLDRSAVIVLTSEMDDRMIGRTTQMNIDHQELFRPLTKATFRLDPGNISETLLKALMICREEYPGPVHLGLPADIAGVEISSMTGKPTEPADFKSPGTAGNIISLLGKSRRPLIAAGLTARRLEIRSMLLRFLEKYKIPVVTTPMAKGILSEDHPSYAGVLFHALSDRLEELCHRSDLVIGIGYDPVEYNYESWIPEVPLIHFDTKETDMPDTINALQYSGPPADWFRILENMNPGSVVPDPALIKGIRDEMATVFEGLTGHFGPVSVLKILKEELPADSVISVDVGSHLHLAGQYWKTGGNGNFIISNGWSGMGFGIPASIAAAVAKPFARSVCITGDGGFLMSAGEMMTARRYNYPVIVIVFSDGELNLIKLKQSWKNLGNSATDIFRGDLFGSDVFLGIKVFQAYSCETMHSAINAALMLNEPVIINAAIDPDDYRWLIVRR